MLSFVILSLTACGGGGGGGGGGSSSSSLTTGNSNWISSASTSSINSYKTSEYNAQWGLDTINAAEAYALLSANSKTVAGEGVTIAIIDTGVQLSHVEIAGNYSSSGSNDYVSSNSNPNETSDSHGTHVASIAAGVKDNSGMHGVAYDSTLMIQRALGNCDSFGNCDFYYGSIGDSASAGAKVINLSLGGSASSLVRNELIEAKSRDSLTVAATGNDNLSQPSYPARYASDSSLTGYILAVGAIAYDGSIASYSNDCGDAKSYCLVAPGGSNDGNNAHSIYAAVPTDNYDYKNGTSMATPMVSGAAAVIRGAWTFLTAPQVAQILLRSANRSFSGYSDTIHGQGILDLEAAVQAQGQNTLGYGTSVVLGSGYDLSNTSLMSSPIFGDAFSANVAPQISGAIFYDDYGRDYKANLGDRIKVNNGLNSAISLDNLIFNNYAQQLIPLSFDGKTKMNFNLASFKNSEVKNELGLKYAVIDPSLDPYRNMNSSGFSFTRNSSDVLPDSKFGFAFNFDEISNQKNQGNLGFMMHDSIASNPYQSFMNQASSSSLNSRKFSQIFLDQYLASKKLGLHFSYQESRDSSIKQNEVVDAALSFKDFRFAVGSLTEYENNILNSRSLGAFESQDDVKTTYFKLSFDRKITSDFRFLANFSEGVSKIQGNERGIFRRFEDVRSRSFSAAIIWKKFGLNYLEPMRVYRGRVAYDIPIARDNDGNLYRSQGYASLAPNGKERDLEAFYLFDIDQNNQFKLSFLMQREPGNIKSAPTNYMAIFGYKKNW